MNDLIRTTITSMEAQNGAEKNIPNCFGIFVITYLS